MAVIGFKIPQETKTFVYGVQTDETDWQNIDGYRRQVLCIEPCPPKN